MIPIKAVAGGPELSPSHGWCHLHHLKQRRVRTLAEHDASYQVMVCNKYTPTSTAEWLEAEGDDDVEAYVYLFFFLFDGSFRGPVQDMFLHFHLKRLWSAKGKIIQEDGFGHFFATQGRWKGAVDDALLKWKAQLQHHFIQPDMSLVAESGFFRTRTKLYGGNTPLWLLWGIIGIT